MRLILQILVLCLLPAFALAKAPRPAARPTPLSQCPSNPVVCTMQLPVFSFGRHDIHSTEDNIYATGSFSVSCTKTINPGVDLTLDLEISALPRQSPRRLATGGDLVDYDLYLDATLSRPWGDGSGGTVSITEEIILGDSIRNFTRTYLLYGLIPAGQTMGSTGGGYLGLINVKLAGKAKCRG